MFLVWAILNLCPSNIFAQPTDETVYADRARILTRASIGTATLPTSSSLRLDGLLTTGATDVVFINGSNEVVRRILAKSDLPTATAYEDESNVFTLSNTFNSGLTIGGNVAGQSGTLLFSTPTRVIATVPSLRLTESDAGTDLKNLLFYEDGGQFALRTENDALSTGWDFIRGYRRTTADIYGPVGSSATLEFGGNVRNAVPGLNNVLLMGSPVRKIHGLYVSEVIADVFTVVDKQVIGNGSFRVGRGTTLTRDLSNVATTIYVKNSVFRYLDFVYLQGLGSSGQPQFEAIQIIQSGAIECDEDDADTVAGNGTTLPIGCLGVDNNDYAFTVDRNEDGAAANTWVAGDGVVATDRYMDLFSWQSAVISGGGAILGDRPLAYWNFDGPSTTQLNRAAESGGTITALNSTAAGAGGGFSGAGDSWNRNGLANGQIFSTSVSSMNTGASSATELACSMSIELIYFVNGTTPGPGDGILVASKWNGASLATATFILYHYGSGNVDNGKMVLLGAPISLGTTAALTPKITPSANNWHHLVFTYSNVNGGKAYVDGVLTGTPTAPVGSGACMAVNANNVEASLWGNNGNPFGGHIAELAIYASELSASQVYAHQQAFFSNRAGLSAGPTIVGYERTSDVNWYGISERWACGNIVGLYGYQQITYGCGWGDTTSTYTTATASDGFSIWNAGVRKFWADTAGNLSLTGDLVVGTTGIIRTAGATAGLLGSGIYMDGLNNEARFGDPSGQLFYWDGNNVTLKSQNIWIQNGQGIQIRNNTGGYNANEALHLGNLTYGGRNSLYGFDASNARWSILYNSPTTASVDSIIQLQADGTTAAASEILIQSTTASGSQINFNTDTIRINGLPGYTGTITISGCNVTVNDGIITNSSC